MTISIPKWLLLLLLVVLAAGAGVGITLALTRNGGGSTSIATRPPPTTTTASLSAVDDAYLPCAKRYQVWLNRPNAAEPKCALLHNLAPVQTVDDVLRSSHSTLSTEIPSEGETVALYLNQMIGIARAGRTPGFLGDPGVVRYRRLQSELRP